MGKFHKKVLLIVFIGLITHFLKPSYLQRIERNKEIGFMILFYPDCLSTITFQIFRNAFHFYNRLFQWSVVSTLWLPAD